MAPRRAARKSRFAERMMVGDESRGGLELSNVKSGAAGARDRVDPVMFRAQAGAQGRGRNEAARRPACWK